MPRNDRPPSFQFYPADYLADPAVAAMSFDEQGRYWWAICWSWQTHKPGQATEAQWRRWMAYSDEEWAAHREAIAAAFKVSADGLWVQKRTVETRVVQRRIRARASRGGAARKQKLSPERRSEIARNAALSMHSKRRGQAGLLSPSSSSSSSSSSAKKESTHTHKQEAESVCVNGTRDALSHQHQDHDPISEESPDPTRQEIEQFVKAYPRRTTVKAVATAMGRAVRRHRHDQSPIYGPDLVQAAHLLARLCENNETEEQFIPSAKAWLDRDGFLIVFEQDREGRIEGGPA